MHDRDDYSVSRDAPDDTAVSSGGIENGGLGHNNYEYSGISDDVKSGHSHPDPAGGQAGEAGPAADAPEGPAAITAGYDRPLTG